MATRSCARRAVTFPAASEILIMGLSAMSSEGTESGRVQGTASYRERISLPANAVFEATLEDVSRVGAEGEIIARVRNEQPGNPPIPFVIAYDRGRINQSRRYAVRGRILVDGNLWFTTDQQHPVLTAGHGDVVQLQLRRANAPSPEVPPIASSSTATLENTYWKLTNLGAAPIKSATQRQEPHFILHSATRRVTGSAGCNRLTGSYELAGDHVAFKQLATGMMACGVGMDTERAFLKALGGVSRWKISGRRLELLSSPGAVLAILEAVNTK